jgi:hypothetical protein
MTENDKQQVLVALKTAGLSLSLSVRLLSAAAGRDTLDFPFWQRAMLAPTAEIGHKQAYLSKSKHCLYA